jgi:signal transduction histidine kinase
MTEEALRAEVERLVKRVDRERRAREEAENLAERGIRELYERQRELEMLHVIADAANAATSLHDAIQVTLDEICSYTGWPVGHAYFVGADPDLLEPGRIWHLDQPVRFEQFRRVTEATTFRRGIGLPGMVLKEARCFWIPDVSKAENFPRAKQSVDIGVVAAFAFPVMVKSSVMAVLEFFSGERVEREETWLKIAGQVGLQLGRIFERQHAAKELEEANKELLDLSRRAGMAEVATGVLHNVGNVLNSVSVSATLIADGLRKSKVGNLRLATDMILSKNGDLGAFLTTDAKGRLLPDYLAKAAGQIEREHEDFGAEVASMTENIEHIKGIVAMQQNYAKVSGMKESLSPANLVEDALRMNYASLHRHRIHLVREVEDNLPQVNVDRHKVLQILINLIRNAKHALGEGEGEKRLTVRVEPLFPWQVRISVSDNGMGIVQENLNKIFNHGFTTKKEGHGFGLHSGANAAKEMGGSLHVYSAGEGRGATFVLDLPATVGSGAAKTA